MTTEATARPWWANLLTSALTTLIGAVLIVVAVCVLRPELAPNGDVYWGGLFTLGLAFVMTGGSMLGVHAARGSSPPPRGSINVQALEAVAAVAFALLLILFAAMSAQGCALLERRKVLCTTTPRMALEDLPDGRCALRGYCDGHEEHTQIGPGPCGEIEELRRTPAEPDPAPSPEVSP